MYLDYPQEDCDMFDLQVHLETGEREKEREGEGERELEGE